MRALRCGLLLSAALLCSGGVFAQSADYVVGPQDVLTITVFDQADLSGKYSVAADGTFSFPLIGRIKAGGMSLPAIEDLLKKSLADGYFKNPQLSVGVESYRSQRIFIVGEVKEPGAYPLTGDMSFIEALARAKSATTDAAGQAVIVRPAPGKAANGPTLPDSDAASEILKVDLKDLERGSKNITLKDGDTIFVPRAEKAYVFGQVKVAGAYPIDKGTTVLQALSLAGGVSDRGSTSRIKIVRVVNGEKKEITAKLGDIVQPGDTIIVQQRFF